MGFSCCVVNCKNTSTNSEHKFYSFPTAPHKIQQRIKWIQAVKRINADGSAWKPKPSDRICSAHFIGGRKDDAETSPSYLPTVFPCTYRVQQINQEIALKRHARFLNRRSLKKVNVIRQGTISKQINIQESQENIEYENQIMSTGSEQIMATKTHKEQECQVDECQFDINSKQDGSKTLVCNRIVNVTIDPAKQTKIVTNDAEIQTDIMLGRCICVRSQKKIKSKTCNTEKKVYVDSEVNVQPTNLGMKERSFKGYQSLEKEEQILDLAGVSFETFEFLLERTPEIADNNKLSKKDRLFVVLMKLKTGLTFAAMGVLFCVHRTTISKIFLSTLQYLASATANLVFWPSKSEVQCTMPECFYPDYSNTRVIIDCTEFRIEQPPGADNRIHSFSYYKKGYTAKILICITPGGFICLKSKVAGGRKSDSQITIESGLIDLLEEGDVVLADKGFPEIRKVISDSGKSALIVMPPFLENKGQFRKAETEETYKVASVRIHVERAIQRLKIYQILNKIPASLFHYMDDLLHVICVLVNLQPPIHSKTENHEKNQ